MDEMKDKLGELLNSLAQKFECTKEDIYEMFEQGKKQAEDLKTASKMA